MIRNTSNQTAMNPLPNSDLILYQTEDGRTRVQCRFENETVWLTQKQMAELFGKDVRTINEHIQNVVAEGELVADSVIRKFRITAADGKAYETQHYNLDVIRREDEIEELNRLVVMFLDFAEDQARRRKQVFLQNWLTRLHDFLNLNERAILPDSGKVSREEAHQLAEKEYERFAARRRAALEAQGEADLLGLLEAEVKKLPQPRKPKPSKS